MGIRCSAGSGRVGVQHEDSGLVLRLSTGSYSCDKTDAELIPKAELRLTLLRIRLRSFETSDRGEVVALRLWKNQPAKSPEGELETIAQLRLDRKWAQPSLETGFNFRFRPPPLHALQLGAHRFRLRFRQVEGVLQGGATSLAVGRAHIPI